MSEGLISLFLGGRAWGQRPEIRSGLGHHVIACPSFQRAGPICQWRRKLEPVKRRCERGGRHARGRGEILVRQRSERGSTVLGPLASPFCTRQRPPLGAKAVGTMCAGMQASVCSAQPQCKLLYLRHLRCHQPQESRWEMGVQPKPSSTIAGGASINRPSMAAWVSREGRHVWDCGSCPRKCCESAPCSRILGFWT